jgi:methionine--tRNA ligase beta chain
MAEEIDYLVWEKLDLRVAEIEKVEDIPGADKLYKLSIDVGELGKRTICAGIKQYYQKEELQGRKIILFANLAPRVMKGIKSEGMLLAASNEDKSKVILMQPRVDVDSGIKVEFKNIEQTITTAKEASIEDFVKVDLRIGEIKEIKKGKIIVSCNNKEFSVKLDSDVKKNEKIAVIIEGDRIIIPILNKNIPLIPEKDIEPGSKIS